MRVKGKLYIDLWPISSNNATHRSGFVQLTHALPNENELLENESPSPIVYGIPPEKITTNSQHEWENVHALAKHERCIAIGPVGLNKSLPIPFEQQWDALILQLETARANKMPVLFYLTNSYPEIVALREKYKSDPPWVFLNFHENDVLAGDLLKLNCYLSFGPLVLQSDSRVARHIDLYPENKILFNAAPGFEIEKVYKFAAQKLNKTELQVMQQVIKNFNGLFD